MQTQIKQLEMLYDLLRHLYLTEPTVDFVKTLSQISLSLHLNTPQDEDDEVMKGISLIVQSIRNHRDNLNILTEKLAEEFARLFIGPKTPVAIPFASFYLSDNKSLMTDETIEVRKMYLEAGLSVQNLYKTPDDQIGIEIEFLYFLTKTILDTEDINKKERLESLYKRFFYDHFVKWVPTFATLVIEGADEEFYKGAGYLLRGVTRL